MNIILDAFGGDHAPLEVIKGAAGAVNEYGVSVTLCGMEDKIRETARQNGVSLEGVGIAPASLVMPVTADPAEILKSYTESSMSVGLKLLASGGGDAFVTAGSTGAVVVGASLIVGRIKGVKRPAIAAIIPSKSGCYMLIDAGANAECRPEMLQQFGIMGSAYMQKVVGIANPRVGVVNIGTEDNKGLGLQIEANSLLRGSPVNFIGNVEARELPLGGCDVAVCDGFVGNVVLKLTEGMGKWMSAELKNILFRNMAAKLAALAIKGGIKDFGKRMDYTEHGGAPLMGISRPVIKAHGSSNAKAIKNAVRQAKIMCENNMIPLIIETMASIKSGKAGEGEGND